MDKWKTWTCKKLIKKRQKRHMRNSRDILWIALHDLWHFKYVAIGNRVCRGQMCANILVCMSRTHPTTQTDYRCTCKYSWRFNQMKTFSALLSLCAGNTPVTGEFTSQRPVTRRFGVFFDLRLDKRLSKQWWGWWFETPPCTLWRHCNYRI